MCKVIELNTKYIEIKFNDNLTNMKKTWEGINSILARKSNNSKPISYIQDPDDNNSISSSPSRIANILNKHFASVWPKLAKSYHPSSATILIFLTDLTLLIHRLLSI